MKDFFNAIRDVITYVVGALVFLFLLLVILGIGGVALLIFVAAIAILWLYERYYVWRQKKRKAAAKAFRSTVV